MICSKDAMSKLKRLTCDHVMAMTKKIQVEPDAAASSHGYSACDAQVLDKH